ncbi:hypothetical protein NC653_024213 [Populus alba x Populus x berolinensis]|uniref:Uncharacterized protein n=1 Tax=Populus alba x Populus x berolinensis TaxID=444605 RepID=A0AAD6M8A4_9ROSI|nr:hypothetical protein NC653_024213 [Populus alba x Populus x berolinensis]
MNSRKMTGYFSTRCCDWRGFFWKSLLMLFLKSGFKQQLSKSLEFKQAIRPRIFVLAQVSMVSRFKTMHTCS